MDFKDLYHVVTWEMVNSVLRANILEGYKKKGGHKELGVSAQ